MSNAKDATTPKSSVPRKLQQMWLQLVHAKWSSLVVVPTEPSASARPITGALAEMVPFYELGEFNVVDGIGISYQDASRLAKEIPSLVSEGARVVVAVESPLENAAAVPLVMAADSALLLVRLGASGVKPTRTIIDIVGRERIVGAVTV
jgi:hypothetical protein